MLAHPANCGSSMRSRRGQWAWDQNEPAGPSRSPHGVAAPRHRSRKPAPRSRRCVEDRLHVRRRAADDAEHLSRCRLMLQRLPQFRIAVLQFFEQPHVLDGDHGLIGESFEQFDLPVCERTHLRTANMDRADGNTFAKQRRYQRGPNSHRDIAGGPWHPEIRIQTAARSCIWIVSPVEDRPTNGAAATSGIGGILQDGQRPITRHFFVDGPH